MHNDQHIYPLASHFKWNKKATQRLLILKSTIWVCSAIAVSPNPLVIIILLTPSGVHIENYTFYSSVSNFSFFAYRKFKLVEHQIYFVPLRNKVYFNGFIHSHLTVLMLLIH